MTSRTFLPLDTSTNDVLTTSPPNTLEMSTTSTPAAKRRRIETANSTLRKPFRSPVIKPPGQGTSPAAETPVRARAGPAARSALGVGTPSKAAPRPREPGFVWSSSREEFEAKNAALEEEIASLRGSEESEDGKGVKERDELDGLMVKWRSAAQQAADELFETSKSRVQKYGSPRPYLIPHGCLPV